MEKSLIGVAIVAIALLLGYSGTTAVFESDKLLANVSGETFPKVCEVAEEILEKAAKDAKVAVTNFNKAKNNLPDDQEVYDKAVKELEKATNDSKKANKVLEECYPIDSKRPWRNTN